MLGFFLLAMCNLSAQGGEYIIRKKMDIALFASSGSLYLTSYYLQRQVKPLPDALIRGLRKEDVNSFDRVATNNYSGFANAASDAVLVGSILMKSYFIFNTKTKKNAFQIGLVSFQSLIMSQSIANAFKLSLRNRPLMYNPNVSMDVKRHNYNRFSFFSAHTTTVASACFSFAFAHQTYLPDSKYNKIIWFYAITVPALEGLLRVTAGKHYPTDAITAYIVGFGTSYLMHKLHYKKKTKSLGFLIKEPINR